jgi:hypothetical protein
MIVSERSPSNACPKVAGVSSTGSGVGPAAGEADRPDCRDLQISESCLPRWMDKPDVDDGHKLGLTKDEPELVRLRRENPGAGYGD